MFRREFLKLAGLAPLTMVAPEVFASATPQGKAGLGWERVLVLVELKGGNDGLNTVVPFSDPNYARLRPKIGVSRDKVLQLSEQIGLNPALEELMGSWREGQLALALGVGYPNPNRSHFRSIEIWETASDSDEYRTEGWVAQWLAHVQRTGLVADGVVIGDGEQGPLAGNSINTINLNDPGRFIREAKKVKTGEGGTPNPALARILTVQEEITQAARGLEQRLGSAPKFKTKFPGGRFGEQVKTAAQLIAARVPVAVIKVSIGSFDTHSNQQATHERLLKELAGGLAAFRAAMQETGDWDRVLMMTYSEFGRRVQENGSQGTDHGTAAPHFILGGRVKGGIYGEQPALDKLEGGDLVYKLDYRSMYATAATRWWGLQPGAAATGGYPALDCLA